MLINVTQEIIDVADGRPESCIVATAMQAAGLLEVKVGMCTATWNDGKWHIMRLPSFVCKEIEAHVHDRAAKPFSFNLVGHHSC